MKKLRGKLTYANVMSTIAVFIALGGATAFAATQLAKNSVGTKQIKKNAVTGAKVKDNSLTGADINAATLGTVPKATNASSASKADSASHADSASKADNADQLGGAGPGAYVKGADAVGGSSLAGTYASPTLRPPEALHEVNPATTPGLSFCDSGSTVKWASFGSILGSAAFYRDPYGMIHISGSIKCSLVPNNGSEIFTLPAGFRPSKEHFFATTQSAGTGMTGVNEGGVLFFSGTGAIANTRIDLDGIDFRCGPSGVNGCP